MAQSNCSSYPIQHSAEAAHHIHHFAEVEVDPIHCFPEVVESCLPEVEVPAEQDHCGKEKVRKQLVQAGYPVQKATNSGFQYLAMGTQ